MHGTGEMHKKFVRKPEDNRPLGRHTRTTLKWILKKQKTKMWTGFIWFWTGSSGNILWRWWAYKFNRRWL